jgi:large subunit ribosomal protein LP0
VRKLLRGKAAILFGKNTMVRKILREYAADGHPEVSKLVDVVQGNLGFCFTNEDVKEMVDAVESAKRPAAARPGMIAPLDVYVPPGPTGLDPGQTNFFQALNIPTKIFKGQIEMTSNLKLITKGTKVGVSEAALLSKLNICPFSYNLIVENIYDDGSVYSRKVLELTDDDLRLKFLQGASKIASLSFAIGYPTLASVPHSIVNGFKKLLAIAVASEVTFEQVEQIKEYIKDPSAFASANAAAAPAAGGADAPAEEEAEEEESSSGGGGAGLFGDDSDSDSDSD